MNPALNPNRNPPQALILQPSMSADQKTMPRNDIEFTRYPETSLFDFEPIPFNLSLCKDIRDAFEDKARFETLNLEARARFPSFNPLPLIPDIFDTRPYNLENPDITFPFYRQPPELPQLDGNAIRFIKCIARNPEGSDVFLIEFQANTWLLKLVSL